MSVLHSRALGGLLAVCLCVMPFASTVAHETDTGPDGRESLNLASVNAAVAYVGEEDLVYGKHARRPVPIASLTKLMTAVVVLESGAGLDEWLEVYERHRPAAANAYSRIRIGSELRRADMLRLALMSSENLAAYTLARHHPGGYDAFVAAMNTKAAQLGMTDTTFVDPTGLSTDNISTAADLVKLANAATAHPQISDLSTTRYYSANFRQPRYRLAYGNTNLLVHRDSWGVGISKTGYLTEAGRCLVMTSQIDGKEVITVLLDSFGTRSPIGDAGRVKRWLTTGDGGQVAGAALRYEQKKNASLASGQAEASSGTH